MICMTFTKLHTTTTMISFGIYFELLLHIDTNDFSFFDPEMKQQRIPYLLFYVTKNSQIFFIVVFLLRFVNHPNLFWIESFFHDFGYCIQRQKKSSYNNENKNNIKKNVAPKKYLRTVLNVCALESIDWKAFWRRRSLINDTAYIRYIRFPFCIDLFRAYFVWVCGGASASGGCCVRAAMRFD